MKKLYKIWIDFCWWVHNDSVKRVIKRMLGDKIISVQFVKASENLDLCKELGIKAIPALVKDDKTVVFDLGEIVSEVENAK